MGALFLLMLVSIVIACLAVLAFRLLPSQNFQFSIRHLLLTTAAIALYCAVIPNPEGEWLILFVPLTFGLLGFGILAAIYRRDATRAFWNGFEIFGWGFLVLFLFFGGYPRRDGQMLLMLMGCLPVALIGGWTARYLRNTRDLQPEERASVHRSRSKPVHQQGETLELDWVDEEHRAVHVAPAGSDAGR